LFQEPGSGAQGLFTQRAENAPQTLMRFKARREAEMAAHVAATPLFLLTLLWLASSPAYSGRTVSSH
jgi:hypothetical protein